MIDRFFISGCQRSGTTMLRLILDSHPFIQCFDEIVSYNFLSSSLSNSLDKLPPLRKELKFIGFKVPRFTEQLTWSTFSDNDYGTFPSFYSGEKVVHIFRNVLDVVGSMIRLKSSDGISWLDKYGRSILETQIANPNIHDTFKKKYKYLRKLGFPRHLVGSLYWEIKNQGFFELLNTNKQVYGINYEALVLCPKNELYKICEFLSVCWDDAMLKHYEKTHDEIDENGIAIGGTDARRPIDDKSISRYMDIITEDQIKDIQSFSEETIKKIADKL